MASGLPGILALGIVAVVAGVRSTTERDALSERFDDWLVGVAAGAAAVVLLAL